MGKSLLFSSVCERGEKPRCDYGPEDKIWAALSPERSQCLRGENDFFQGKVYDYSIEVGSIDAEQMA